ncbi:MAG: hypothetical protein ABL959_24400 [Pyrinomonadaceae bacterium]
MNSFLKKPIDYNDMRNVRRVRWYRSADRDLPLEVWEMVADLPIFASNFHDNTPNETRKTHYYTCRYVFADGCLSGFSAIKAAPPFTKKRK